MGGDAVGHIVAQRVEIHRTVFQDLGIAGLHMDGYAKVLPQPLGKGGILAPDLHVGAVPVGFTHGLLVGQDVGRVAGVGIAGDEAVHVAHLVFGVVVMSVLHGQGAGDELMVQRLQTDLRVVGHGHGGAAVVLAGAQRHDGAKRHHTGVDLVKGQPVFNLSLVPGKDGLAVVHVEVHQLAVGPAIVLFHQGVGQFIVADRDKRLDAVLFTAVEHPVIEGKACLVGLGVLAGREDARPVDGSAEGLEPHLGKEGDVLLVMVVEVDGLMTGIELVRLDGGGKQFRAGVGTVGTHIRDAGTFAVHIPGALKLVGGTGAAP